MRINDRVHLVGGGSFGMSHLCDANLYAIDCGKSTVLVDVGCGLDPAEVFRNIKASGLPAVSDILLTHAHWDHARGLAAFVAELGGKVWAHNDAREELTRHVWSNTYAAQLGAPAVEGCQADVYFSEETVIEVGDMRMRALPSPGHTPDSVCYLIEGDHGGYLFTGDTVLGEGQLGVSDINTDFRALLSSIRRLLALRPSALFPGHHAFCLKSGWVQLEILAETLESKWSGIAAGRSPFMPTWWLQRDSGLIAART